MGYADFSVALYICPNAWFRSKPGAASDRSHSGSAMTSLPDNISRAETKAIGALVAYALLVAGTDRTASSRALSRTAFRASIGSTFDDTAESTL